MSEYSTVKCRKCTLNISQHYSHKCIFYWTYYLENLRRNCIKWSGCNQNSAHTRPFPVVPVLAQYLRSSEKFLCSPMSKCISFGEFRSSSGSCSCLSVCSNYSLLFEFLFCSRFREYARVHPLASYVYLPVFRRMCAHTFRGSYSTREREREREKKNSTNNNFSINLCITWMLFFSFVSLTSSMRDCSHSQS